MEVRTVIFDLMGRRDSLGYVNRSALLNVDMMWKRTGGREIYEIGQMEDELSDGFRGFISMSVGGLLLFISPAGEQRPPAKIEAIAPRVNKPINNIFASECTTMIHPQHQLFPYIVGVISLPLVAS